MSTLASHTLSIFISYDHADVADAKRVIAAIRERYSVLVDEEFMRDGAPVPVKLAEQLNRADVLLVLWSQRAADSEWVYHEMVAYQAHRSAQRKTPHVVVLALDSTPTPMRSALTVILDGDEQAWSERIRCAVEVPAVPIALGANAFYAVIGGEARTLLRDERCVASATADLVAVQLGGRDMNPAISARELEQLERRVRGLPAHPSTLTALVDALFSPDRWQAAVRAASLVATRRDPSARLAQDVTLQELHAHASRSMFTSAGVSSGVLVATLIILVNFVALIGTTTLDYGHPERWIRAVAVSATFEIVSLVVCSIWISLRAAWVAAAWSSFAGALALGTAFPFLLSPPGEWHQAASDLMCGIASATFISVLGWVWNDDRDVQLFVSNEARGLSLVRSVALAIACLVLVYGGWQVALGATPPTKVLTAAVLLAGGAMPVVYASVHGQAWRGALARDASILVALVAAFLLLTMSARLRAPESEWMSILDGAWASTMGAGFLMIVLAFVRVAMRRDVQLPAWAVTPLTCAVLVLLLFPTGAHERMPLLAPSFLATTAVFLALRGARSLSARNPRRWRLE